MNDEKSNTFDGFFFCERHQLFNGWEHTGCNGQRLRHPKALNEIPIQHSFIKNKYCNRYHIEQNHAGELVKNLPFVFRVNCRSITYYHGDAFQLELLQIRMAANRRQLTRKNTDKERLVNLQKKNDNLIKW